MRTKSEISANILRGSAIALLFLCVIVTLSSGINLPRRHPAAVAPKKDAAFGVNGQESAAPAAAPAIVMRQTLTFADRVAYQRSIEEIYWRHRIWPEENAEPKPSLDKVMSQTQIEKKVEDYLRDSQALEDYWQRPITPDQLQAEMERIASHTKQPGVLRELFAALGDDPLVIAECLARPVLTERLVAELNNQADLKVTRITWLKEPLRSWLDKAEAKVPMIMAATSANYTLPAISTEFENSAPSVACTDDTWTATSTIDAPDARDGHSAVWTGTEMIVWGGVNASLNYLNTGGRYDPITDTWTVTSTTNAPTGRAGHTAVWTGSQMVVWGGDGNGGVFSTGGRYNPITDTWTATDATNAPSARVSHTAVWSGSEMIVWGGVDASSNYVDTGGRYNPITDTWTATSTASAPAARAGHTAVFSSCEMIVWGGSGIAGYLNTGGRYDPTTNSWTATSTTNAPTSWPGHTVVLTGSEMIVWGGGIFGAVVNTGGRYNPSTDTWTATSTTNAPAGRSLHTAVWSGSEMIVWGGVDLYVQELNTGGRYNPTTDSWTATSTTNVPYYRHSHTAVWSGNQMIIWGGLSYSGYLNTGGKYCAHNPCTTTEQVFCPASNSVPLDHRLSIQKRAPHSPQQLIINLTFAPDSTFLAAGLSQTDIPSMKIACDYAQSVVASNFSDPINVNIFVTAVPGTCLKGQSSPNFEPAYTYTGFLSHLMSDETSDDDRAALGTGGSIPMTDPIGGSHVYLLTKAQAKALNLVTQIDGTLDGTFTFGGGWQWTYDPLNRAVPCKSDFIGTAMHEFTEIMGRIGLMGANPALPQSYTLMDLFSYLNSNFRGLDNGPSRYFSIDNGTTPLKTFNDALHYGGDLQDWAPPTPPPNPGDLVDARIFPGIQYDLTPVDLRVMDVIGYDRVTGTPTPTPTATPIPTATPTPTPCMGRCAPTPRPRPTPGPRP